MNIDDWTKESWRLSMIFDDINTQYIQKMAKHIYDIGQLTPTDVHRLKEMARMSENMKQINAELAVASNKTCKELSKLYEQSGLEEYLKASIFYRYKRIKQVPFKKNKRIQRYLESIDVLTRGAFQNLSNTAAITQGYAQALDRAIVEVTSGTNNYQAAMRSVIKQYSSQGLKVEYASGYHRRLDSAVRMNVLSGARHVNQGVRLITGQEYGADGVEISAHGLCAEDHLHMQGRIMSNAKYAKENSMLRRPMGEWNCRHEVYPIILGVSEPAYSQEQLQELNDYATEQRTVGGKTYTRYQASQAMRKIETDVRYSKDAIIGAKASHDDLTVATERERIKQNKLMYKEIANTFGIAEHPERMAVSGFTR